MSHVYDYIVVGAGSAGCVVANRLSTDPKHRVLLLEAGGKDWNPWIHIPVGYYRTMYHPDISWGYETEPDSGVNNRVMIWPRGRVLGGSSSINGLLYVRGQHQDYDHWRQLGNEGWGWDDVLPFSRSPKAMSAAAMRYAEEMARFRSPILPTGDRSAKPSSRPARKLVFRRMKIIMARPRTAPVITRRPAGTAAGAVLPSLTSIRSRAGKTCTSKLVRSPQNLS